MDSFVSNILEKAMDIEDLVSTGTRRAVCPYYAARSAVPYADFVVVPYNCLIHKCAACRPLMHARRFSPAVTDTIPSQSTPLHTQPGRAAPPPCPGGIVTGTDRSDPRTRSRSAPCGAGRDQDQRSVPLCRATREALGLRLQGSIVVVDEAHNLLPAIHGSHSVALPSTGLNGTSKLLGTYLDHFQTRLGPAKASTVTAVKNVSDRLAAAAASLLDSPEATAGLGGDCHRVMLPNAFLMGCRLANVNIPKLLAEMDEGNLVFKIAGFADTVLKAVAQGGGPLLTVVEKQEQHVGATAPAQVRRVGAAEALTVTLSAAAVSPVMPQHEAATRTYLGGAYCVMLQTLISRAHHRTGLRNTA